MLKEFRPAILFLLKFGLFFGVLSVAYSFWVKSYTGQPDPVTSVVSDHTVFLLELAGYEVYQLPTDDESSNTIYINDTSTVRVFEGCNGVAVFILFISFLAAFKLNLQTLLFALFGGIIIHVANLFRIAGLAWIAIFKPELMYFTHKYIFTLILYAVVFGLWVVFVRKWGLKKTTTNPA